MTLAVLANTIRPMNDALTAARPASLKSTLPAPAPVAACGCGRAYDLDEWLPLSSRRPWPFPGETIEIAECTCGSTIASAVDDVEVAA